MTVALRMSGVTKKYRGFTLGPLDLELEPGVVLGLIGPNGAGKTTTINIIAGLIRQDLGSMDIFGIRHNLNDPSWKFHIGYVGDTHVFYEYWSGERNLKFLKQFYPDWSDKRVDELAKRFDLDLKKRANTLSKGNRAKLALIGVLAHNPKLLILDEPTSGLDPVVRAEFLETLWELIESGESAVLYSTHILSDINRISDELAFLRDGKIVRRDKKDDLIDSWRSISFKSDTEIPASPEIHISFLRRRSFLS
jgi:ABC-2 type transport system ATP-binding protein